MTCSYLCIGAGHVIACLKPRRDAAGCAACELCGKRLNTVKHIRPHGPGFVCKKHLVAKKDFSAAAAVAPGLLLLLVPLLPLPPPPPPGPLPPPTSPLQPLSVQVCRPRPLSLLARAPYPAASRHLHHRRRVAHVSPSIKSRRPPLPPPPLPPSLPQSLLPLPPLPLRPPPASPRAELAIRCPLLCASSPHSLPPSAPTRPTPLSLPIR